MKHTLYDIGIETEMDIVLAHQKTTQLCALAGLTALVQTQMGTAVSEIARNALEYATQNHVHFYLLPEGDQKPRLEITIVDAGGGIDPTVLLTNHDGDFLHKGNGVRMARKLVDYFHIDSSAQGTTVTLQKAISDKIKLDDQLILRWKKELSGSEQSNLSPYETLKTRNQQLITLTQQLEEQNEANRRQVEEIKTLNAQLDRKNQELTEFAYTLSHDLKNPLSNIMTLTDMAQKAESPGIFLEKIETSAGSIENIVKGLMQIIDVDQDVSEQISSQSFQDIIEKLQTEYADEISTHHARIHTDFQVDTIRYIAPYLNSIIRNLVSNAIKYRAEDRPLELTVSTRPQDEQVVLSVSDNGMGMDLTRNGGDLFKPFRRLTQQKTGTGIGLHLIKKMIEKNGGTIEAESALDQGTTFYCRLKEYESS